MAKCEFCDIGRYVTVFSGTTLTAALTALEAQCDSASRRS
jgi:hypothetical protein